MDLELHKEVRHPISTACLFEQGGMAEVSFINPKSRAIGTRECRMTEATLTDLPEEIVDVAIHAGFPER